MSLNRLRNAKANYTAYGLLVQGFLSSLSSLFIISNIVLKRFFKQKEVFWGLV